MELKLFSKLHNKIEQSKELMVSYLKKDAPSFAIHLLDFFPVRGGQGLRPSLLLAAGMLEDSSANAETDSQAKLLKAAAAIEMIHGGSLLHDDVIDEAQLRRHCPTINLLFGAREATILGDYLLARAFSLIMNIENPVATSTFVTLLENMVKGELLEFHHDSGTLPQAADAMEVMELKTASLFSAACFVGGLLKGLSNESLENLREFGRLAGIAFQITDDLMDITAHSESIGKDTGNDLLQKKPTLPLVYAIQEASEKSIQQLNENHDAPIPTEIAELMSSPHIRQKAMFEARDASNKAKERLTCFADNDAKTALTEFAEFATARA
jgi:octaprenyl-diphosphate synthase